MSEENIYVTVEAWKQNKVLQVLHGICEDSREAFAVLLTCSAAMARDIGAIDMDGYLKAAAYAFQHCAQLTEHEENGVKKKEFMQ